MNTFRKTFVVAALVVAGLAATSPAYAHKKMAPAMNHEMMMVGGMGGMMGMMGMMTEMNKMMKRCTKMMAMMDGHHMKMDMHKMKS